MARTRQLSDLRLDAARLADIENASQRFPVAEQNENINKGIAKLCAEMITVSDKPFFTAEATINCTPPSFGQVSTYALPSNFLRILSVGWSNVSSGASAGPWIPLEPYEEAERVRLTNAGFYGGLSPLRYGITGGPGAFTQGTPATAYSIEVLPAPTNNSLLKIRYIPTPPRLVNDTDQLDGILGFEDYVCTWAAILMRRKDDLDTTELMNDLAMHKQLIHTIAKRRDGSRPPKVSIVRGRMNGMFGGRPGRGWGVW